MADKSGLLLGDFWNLIDKDGVQLLVDLITYSRMKDTNAAITLLEKWPEKIQVLNGI